MTSVDFVFTNPRHHFEMMVPVARELARRGVRARMVSLAELRGMATPPPRDAGGLEVVRVMPNLRRSPKVGARFGHASGGGRFAGVRRAAQLVVWQILAPRLRHLLRRTQVVVVPNDAVYPYEELIKGLRRRGVRVALLQEGIRFTPPAAYGGTVYGTGGVSALCAWGEGSAEHFARTGVPAGVIAVTGNPRFDTIDPAAWREPGAKMLADLGLTKAPVAFLSNPIENQGYGTVQVKLALFEAFLREAGPVLAARDLDVVVKTHLQEDPALFREVAARTPYGARVHVISDGALFAVLAMSRAAIVLASTVGVEALTFGLPLGVVEIPGHGYAFEYVQRGAAAGLRTGAMAAGVTELLDGAEARRPAAAALVERHLHDRGHAAARVADVLERLGRQR
jgi:hypothetical protein